MEDRDCKVVRLSERVGGAGAATRTSLRTARFEVSTVGFDQNLLLTGGDPWGTPNFAGLVVPQTPTTTAQNRYLFLLARHSFNAPESAVLLGIRMYKSLFGFASGQGPFELEITSPMWRFAYGGGNITFHITTIGRGWRDKRNPLSGPSQAFQLPRAPALAYQGLMPYVAPNAGRPYGKPLGNTDYGTVYDNRVQWRTDQVEDSLRIPIPAPCDILLWASVWQHDSTIARPTFSTAQQAAASPEDRFWATFDSVQFGRVAGSLVIEEQLGKEEEP